jgi:uncharacterized protein YdbL (DUF1318 family)
MEKLWGGHKLRKRKSFLVLLVCSLFIISSCVTINIYFPEAVVKEAAEEIVDEVRTEEDEEKEKKDVFAVWDENKTESAASNSMFTFVSSVYAQEQVTQVSSPKIRALKSTLKERFPQLRPFYNQGRIGETNDGLLVIRNEEELSLKDKSRLRRLVKEENSDRKELYAEVAEALNIDPDQIPRIQRIFAENWIRKSRPGWWIQTKEGRWVRKPAEDS